MSKATEIPAQDAREREVLDRIDRARRARARVREERVTLAHGSGGKATHTLIEAIFLEAFRNPLLEELGDAAQLRLGDAGVALTTDSFVVSPLFFPAGTSAIWPSTARSTTWPSPERCRGT